MPGFVTLAALAEFAKQQGCELVRDSDTGAVTLQRKSEAGDANA